MKQKDFVIAAIRELGGAATLSQLYATTDVSSWRTKTPFASIRRIVQENSDFFKIRPGLWGLKSFKTQILKELESGVSSQDSFTHSYFQGLIIEIGNLRKFQTYVPPQDKNKNFAAGKKLDDLTSLKTIYEFAYPNILSKARTVDAIWFNERNLPYAFFEVEHSTDFKNSLNKFYELQDFNAKMFIVADASKLRQFQSVISASIYKDIAGSVKFAGYESIAKQYDLESESAKIKMGI
ncbi:hypothetical protein [Campylobacter rectus]|uniref:hypothetical protein n=1 Tax=Campylobacter rectus TaxID=203 RepID=UPI0023EFB072|nr:hypothetical protein [Campylobacter rectus]